MVRPRRPTLRKQWIQRPYARHASPIRTPAVAATHNAPLAPELPDRHRAREKREVDRRKVRQVAHRPARPRRSRTRRTSPLPKGLRNRAIIAPCCSAVRSAGPRWRRSPMGALRADSRRRRQAPHGTRMRRRRRYGDGEHSARDLRPGFFARLSGSRRAGRGGWCRPRACAALGAKTG